MTTVITQNIKWTGSPSFGSTAEDWDRISPLPVTLEYLTATKLNNTKGLLNWKISQSYNLSEFIIQKSNDAVNYTEIGLVKAKDSTGTYQFTDNNLSDGINYYRLQMMDIDGHFQYSPVRNITDDGSASFIHIFPNPIAKGDLYINTTANCSSIQLCDLSGRVIRSVHTLGLQNTLSMDNISKGVYMVIVITDGGNKVQKIVVE